MCEALGEWSATPETLHFNGCPTSPRLVSCSSRGLLAAALALLSGGFQLAVAFCVDLLLTPLRPLRTIESYDGWIRRCEQTEGSLCCVLRLLKETPLVKCGAA